MRQALSWVLSCLFSPCPPVNVCSMQSGPFS
uniref:Uncharacterized protein n=1 Tax=Setaria viridis TaxID=4556 RepID=A0A4U6T8M9_SETVI|nr:hypothetical protein SEVIR_9G545266v2 [Setaria viridis]